MALAPMFNVDALLAIDALPDLPVDPRFPADARRLAVGHGPQLCHDAAMATPLQETQLAVVRDHMDAENRHDFDAVIATFVHPRYELMATGHVFDGEEEVRQYFASSRAVFPDQRNENTVLHSADNLVIAEFDLLGTHTETGKPFRSRMAALFFFEGEGIVCERVYFDRASVDEQVR